MQLRWVHATAPMCITTTPWVHLWMQATVYVTDWPLMPTRNAMLYVDPGMAVPYDSLQEALADPELQVCVQNFPCRHAGAAAIVASQHCFSRHCFNACSVCSLLQHKPVEQCRFPFSSAWLTHDRTCTAS